MNHPESYTLLLKQTVEELSDTSKMQGLFHQHQHGDPLPSVTALEEIISLCRAVLFPGYYGKSTLNAVTVRYHIGMKVERLYSLLTAQVHAGLCFGQQEEIHFGGPNCHAKAEAIAASLIALLPQVRRTLATDVEAAYLGDPAAQNYGEVISCYPVIRALTCYRIAHELYKLGVPLIPVLSRSWHTAKLVSIFIREQKSANTSPLTMVRVSLSVLLVLSVKCQALPGGYLGS